MLAAPHTIPLLPRHQVWLQGHGYCDEERLARVFRQTWRRLPLRACRAILKLWREQRRPEGPRAQPAPLIEALPNWAIGDSNARDLGVLSSVELSATPMRLCFWAPAVDLLPDEQLATIIAHELAHVAVLAREGSDAAQDEEYVNEVLTTGWGFPPLQLQDWAHEHAEALATARAG